GSKQTCGLFDLARIGAKQSRDEEMNWSVGATGLEPNTPPLHTPALIIMSEISFIDTTLRDGQQSLWALGMKTDAMLGAAAQMDRIGFESMEFFVSIMIKKYVRELKENPWHWVREGTKRFQ